MINMKQTAECGNLDYRGSISVEERMSALAKSRHERKSYSVQRGGISPSARSRSSASFERGSISELAKSRAERKSYSMQRGGISPSGRSIGTVSLERVIRPINVERVIRPINAERVSRPINVVELKSEFECLHMSSLCVSDMDSVPESGRMQSGCFRAVFNIYKNISNWCEELSQSDLMLLGGGGQSDDESIG